MELSPLLVFFRYDDVPGVIGRVGTLFGDAGVNIANMTVSRTRRGGQALMALSIDTPAPSELIDQLHGDLIASSAAVGDIGDARRLLGRTSDLYALLMTFDDFDGCSTMLRNVGDPGRRFSRVHATLASACHDLEGGSRLFTTAANGSDPGALLAAQDTSRLASPLLYRAELELNAAKRHRR